MNIYIDIDHTLAHTVSMDYDKATPMSDSIEYVNELYNQGHNITLWTARGTVSGIDYRSLTETQLKKWGVKYHDLRFGKPAFDVLIDDKAFNSVQTLRNIIALSNKYTTCQQLQSFLPVVDQKESK